MESKRVKLKRGVFCDLKQLTDTAVAIVTRELNQKGLRITPNADKTMRMRVVKAMWTPKFFTQTGELTLEAALGNGACVSVDGRHETGGNAFRALNGATLFAAIAILQNPRLAAYLKSQ